MKKKRRLLSWLTLIHQEENHNLGIHHCRKRFSSRRLRMSFYVGKVLERRTTVTFAPHENFNTKKPMPPPRKSFRLARIIKKSSYVNCSTFLRNWRDAQQDQNLIGPFHQEKSHTHVMNSCPKFVQKRRPDVTSKRNIWEILPFSTDAMMKMDEKQRKKNGM